MGFIYCITSPSNKKYIGQTTKTVQGRFESHCKTKECRAINNAIQCYGVENMVVETLLEVNDSLLDDYEKKFIIMYDTMVPKGYNIRSGGSNGIHCEESRQLMRELKLGEKNHNYGKQRTDVCKQRISEAKSGEKHHFFGKTFTDEHKERLSKAHKTVSDNDFPMYLVYVQPRPEHYSSSGYAVVNHPTLPNKYFTSKKLSDDKKKELALQYLANMDAVQRLNGNG